MPSADGDTWRQIIDGLRSTTQLWWQSLSTKEQRRFFNHLLTYWEVHRHRMAPDIGRKVAGACSTGQLTVLAGRIISISELPDYQGRRLAVIISERGKAEAMTITVNKVINCTGPQSSLKQVDSVLLANLLRRGLVAPHRLGTGIAVSADGQLLDKFGSSVVGLLAIGPLLKAELLESVAVPELRQQALALAAKIADMAKLKDSRLVVVGKTSAIVTTTI